MQTTEETVLGSKRRDWLVIMLALGLLAAFVVSNMSARSHSATSGAAPAANKVGVFGSALQVMGPGVDVPLATGTVKAGNPTDLLIQFTAECDILTRVYKEVTVEQSTSTAEATVTVWATVDGKAVPVSGNDTTDPGRVVFCNRSHTVVTKDWQDSNGDTEKGVIDQYLKTREANAFNWVQINLTPGSINHVIQIWARFNEDTSTDPTRNLARGLIGKRTLIVEPTKLAQGISI